MPSASVAARPIRVSLTGLRDVSGSPQPITALRRPSYSPVTPGVTLHGACNPLTHGRTQRPDLVRLGHAPGQGKTGSAPGGACLVTRPSGHRWCGRSRRRNPCYMEGGCRGAVVVTPVGGVSRFRAAAGFRATSRSTLGSAGVTIGAPTASSCPSDRIDDYVHALLHGLAVECPRRALAISLASREGSRGGIAVFVAVQFVGPVVIG